MDLLPKALQPLKSAARAFFRAELRLQHDSGRLRVRFAGSAAEAPALPPPEPAAVVSARRERALLAAMQDELGAVLDELPDLRAENRHLAFFEAALRRSGPQAMHDLPLEVLERALEQLEGLVTNWSAEGLACLRSKMAMVRRERRRAEGMSSLSSEGVSAGLGRPPAR
jgi:hypothetical protein